MNPYLYVICYNPTKGHPGPATDKFHLVSKLEIVVAPDDVTARNMASLTIPKEYHDKMDKIEIRVRRFDL